VLIVEHCGVKQILCTLAFNADGLCRESDWRDAILCDRVVQFTSVIFMALFRHCSTYIPVTFLLHIAAGLSMPMTFAVPSKLKLSVR